MWQSRIPDGRGLTDAMTKALQDAKVKSEDIDYVNAHAPSTTIGDASEMKALKSVFPAPQSVKVSSTKALTGHGLTLEHNGSRLLLPSTQGSVPPWFCECYGPQIPNSDT